MPTTFCDFCDEFRGRRNNSFHRIYADDPRSRLLLRSADFAILPTLGQITEGYLLLAPIEHFTCFGDLSNILLERSASLSASITASLTAEYGSCILFEHGTRSSDAGGCGISHAHLHAVPIPVDLDPVESLRTRFPHRQLTDFREIMSSSKGLPGYLFYQDSLSRPFLFEVGSLPSQFMRKILAEALGTEDWDWRIAQREQRLIATSNRLMPYFSTRSNLYTGD